ncbi:MAG: hypothetical protein IPM54_33540 [Polyangiaceae bacterium]|nr:hypothetical protein [Polyangiaceae bacterium]
MLRHWFRLQPLVAVLLMVTLVAPTITGCMRPQLPQNVRRAAVCRRPPPVDPDADYFAYRAVTDEWVSDTDADDFQEFAPYADIIYIYESTAPSMSMSAMPSPFNLLSCDNPNAVLPRTIYTGQRLPFAYDMPLMQAGLARMSTTIMDVDPMNVRFVGVVPSSQKRSGPEIIRVCTHPPDVRPDAAEWLFTSEKAGASYTRDSDLYGRLRTTAVRVYVYDPTAPPESVFRFPKPYDQLRCSGKPLPGEKPPPGADPQYKAAVDAKVRAITAKASVSVFGGTGGSDKRTWTSSPDGNGSGLTFFEEVVRQMVIAGAFQDSDTSGNLKDPNGSRHGIPSGKNVGGPDSLMLQLTAGTFMLLTNPLRSTGAFARKIASAAKRKGILIVTNPALMPKKLAEQLVAKYGDDMAPSLHQLQTILPYSRMQMFTANWRQVFEAHKILERDMWKDVFGRTDFENLPAIILKKKEHQKITKTLKDAQDAWIREQVRLKKPLPKNITKEALWDIYQDVYRKNPEWLRAIKHFFE